MFSLEYLKNIFNKKFRIDQFSYVDEKGELHENINIEKIKNSFKCNYGCGIFEMTKL